MRYATLITVTAFVIGSSFCLVFAEGNELPKPGITPASRFYFLDEWSEKIVYWFTFGLESKTERLLDFADEKLAEAQKLLEKNKIPYAEKARDKYKEYLNKAQELAQKAKTKGKESLVDKLVNLISQKTLSHQGVLTDLYEKVSEKAKAKEVILNIIEISKKGFEQALQILSTEEKRNEIFQRFKDLKTEIDEKIEDIRKKVEQMGIPLR